MEPASIWQLQELRHFARPGNGLHIFTVVFHQCCWSAPYRKPTRLLTNLSSLRSWGPLLWPQFDALGNYQGPAVDLCQCKPSITLARQAHDDTFRTMATSIYPEPMDRAIAEAIFQALLAAPSSAEEGGGRGVSCKQKKSIRGRKGRGKLQVRQH